MVFFLIGMWVGAIMGFCAIGFFPGKQVDDMQSAIKECEKTLPRNIQCVIRAEPMLKEKN